MTKEDILTYFKHINFVYNDCTKYDTLSNMLEELDQEQKTGHWIYTGDYITDGMLKCSQCGFEHDVSERFLYCPNCGAKMESEV